MIWTEAAKQDLLHFVSEYIKANPNEGIVKEDFEQDIKNHIEEMCLERNIEKVDNNDIHVFLGDMGFPTLVELKAKNTNLTKENMSMGKATLIFSSIFLVIIPQICSIVAWSMSTGDQFRGDFYAHFNKILLVIWALGGIGNGYLLYIIAFNKFEKQKIFFYLLSFNLFLCIYYMLNFIIILPFGVISLVFFGFGLLIFAPYINFIILAVLSHRFKRKLLDQNIYISRNYKKMGFGCFLLVFTIAYFSEILMLMGYQLYKFDSNELKQWGRKMLISVFEDNGEPKIIGEALLNFKVNSSNELHYKIFGKLPKPQNGFNGTNNFWNDSIDSEEDFEREINELALNSSEIDGSINVENGIAYLEWTMIFKSEKTINLEALAKIKLPTDAVVSRLTLWVNDEEREAAFAKDSVVEEAYNSVVNKNRDPVLVQYKSPGIISMKCFPVSKTTPMKIRIGITAPVQYLANDEAYVKMPYFLKSNFEVSGKLQHHIWIESKKPIRFKNESSKIVELNHKLNLKLNNKELTGGVPLYASFNKHEKKPYYYKLNNDKFLTSSFGQTDSKEIEKIIMIIDFGSMIKSEFSHFENALTNLPKNKDIFAYCVSDTIKNIHIPKAINSPELLKAEVQKFKLENDLVGGHDFVPVLLKVFDEHEINDKNLFIWIHGDITFSSSEVEPLEKIFMRSEKKPNLIEFSTSNAINILTNKSKELSNIAQGQGPENGLKNLATFFNSLDKPKFCFVYEVKDNINQADFMEGNKHQARLWAYEEIKKMGLRSEENKTRAIELSVTYQLVTPFVGAVVLENQSQYDQFNLKPVDVSTVPSIPEPEEVALILLLCFFLLYIIKTKINKRLQNV